MKLKNTLLLVIMLLCITALTFGVVGCKHASTTSDSTDASDTATQSASADTGESGEEHVAITGVNYSTNLLSYKANKSVKTEADKRNEFFDLEQSMFVGDDNAFDVKPSVAFRLYKANGKSEAYVPETWTYQVDVYVLNGDNYVLLEGQDVDTYIDAISLTDATVDFSTDAIGYKFKIVSYPDGLTEKQSADEDYKMTVEVEVMDGYNVYSAKELAYVDNCSNFKYDNYTDYNNAWAQFKAANGLTAATPAAVILQTNISITKEDIPAYYFWTAEEVNPSDGDYSRVVGSLKDFAFLYFRDLGVSGTFTFEGNYFTLDSSKLPYVVRPFDDIVGVDETYESHSSLFYFSSNMEGHEGETNTAQATIKDVNFIGNSPKVEDTTKSGGVILLKGNTLAFTAYNNIANSFVINYMAESTDRPFCIEKCKAYDSFTSLIYVWGSKDVHIIDSELIGAGGPVMMVDHTGVTDADGGHPSCVTVENSELHSYVTGQEAWFKMYNADFVVYQIVMMNAGFAPFGRSFVKTRETGDGTLSFIDFVALYKSGESEGMTATKVSGKFSEDNAALPMDFGTYADPWDNFATNTPISTYIETVLGINPEIPIFMTSGGGTSFFSPDAIPAMGIGAGLNNIVEGAPQQIMDPNDNMFKGNQLYLYYSRMAIVFNYFNAGETI